MQHCGIAADSDLKDCPGRNAQPEDTLLKRRDQNTLQLRRSALTFCRIVDAGQHVQAVGLLRVEESILPGCLAGLQIQQCDRYRRSADIHGQTIDAGRIWF